MEKYYVTGCKGQDDDIVICDDSEAEFWTLYQRMADGTSQGIIDLKFREDAEAAMAVYVERDALQQKLVEKERLLNGVPQEAIDGGWTAKGLSDYAKSLEGKLSVPSPSIQDGDLKALLRFNETSEDGEGYDIDDEAMDRLVELGMVAKERAGMRVITSFGMWVIAREQGEEVDMLETQRDRDLAFQQKIAQLRADVTKGDSDD